MKIGAAMMIVAWARGMRHLLGVGAEHAHDAGDGRCHAVTIDRHRDAVNGTEVMAEPANLSTCRRPWMRPISGSG